MIWDQKGNKNSIKKEIENKTKCEYNQYMKIYLYKCLQIHNSVFFFVVGLCIRGLKKCSTLCSFHRCHFIIQHNSKRKQSDENIFFANFILVCFRREFSHHMSIVGEHQCFCSFINCLIIGNISIVGESG